MSGHNHSGSKWAVGALAGVLFLPVLLIAPLSSATEQATQQQQQTASTTGGGLNTSKVPAAYLSLVQQAGTTCAEYPAALLAAQIEAESGWNPTATSPVGAEGIAQFMPGTWAGLGVAGSPLDPNAAIPAMAKYMCSIISDVKAAMASGKVTRGTLIQNALAAYNCGEGNLYASHGFPTGIAETDAYVPKILALQTTYTAPAATTLALSTGAADLTANGPCPLGNSDHGTSCNAAIAYAVGRMNDPTDDTWNNGCLRLVTTAYGGQYAGIGNLWAITSARAVQAAGLMQPPTTNYAGIPRGAVLWYDHPGHPGHVAISVGGGMAITTDAPRVNHVGVVPIAYFENTWHETFVGWSPPRL